MQPNRPDFPEVVEESNPEQPITETQIKAPWETQGVVNPELEKLLSKKQIKEALLWLAEKVKTAPTESVFVEQASLFLKLGRPEEALASVSEFVSLNQLAMEDVPPSLSLIVAYAYKSQKDIDQTFAWFGVCLRKSSSSEVIRIAKQEVKNLLARISESIFADYFIKWERDQSLSPLILEEQIRRRQGGAVIRLEELDYFSPDTYGYSVKEIPKSLPLASSPNGAEIAVMLPVKSSRALEEQKKAIELALRTANPPIAYETITAQTPPLSNPPKIILNLSAKNFAEGSQTNETVNVPLVISLNPRLIGSQSSISPTVAQEVQELVKVIENDAQCEQIFAVVDESISLPPNFKRTSVDELLEMASAESSIALPCLVSSSELEEQIEKLTRIKARWSGLRLFGPSSWVDPVLLQTYHGLFEGSVFVTPFYSGSSRELVREFISSFQNSAATVGTYATALAYDAGRISALILGNKLPEGASYDLQSVTGIESFVVSIDKASGIKRVGITQRRFIRLALKNGDLEEMSSY